MREKTPNLEVSISKFGTYLVVIPVGVQIGGWNIKDSGSKNPPDVGFTPAYMSALAGVGLFTDPKPGVLKLNLLYAKTMPKGNPEGI